MGWAISIVSGIDWLTVGLINGHPHAQDCYPNWCCGSDIFFLIAQPVSSVRMHLIIEKSLDREGALTGVPIKLAFKEHCDILFPLASRNRSPKSPIF
ncbi:MAG: hypothetical protein COS82_03120 [Zetaproteobacteria bacterium CG06_land_8_20_14_3_00_59_53]|nr:MAG: hypothetical protein AUK36_04740 [Zetaproteobacteria bacterium CG2_30_59_37]PIO89286.1 MAG: hypothetical protein COX56_08005 [Zetaproteobacteria bacterium CG23_combo_of_CG06-09_8_20_14_all_59_86]PIQ65357.1 MAG: hypothetical protein COV97_04360 [Zetaproteobacteria bacterium CG11_big_fil_rev_8_21_14_0_20_59_439]PIU71065.1 MAG: hypothetical protein COS82_03120 [Zetaproteobacteria bacterium CG06_land_8_20_14_3_00_59_53]PIU98146.1 MAG: hypothetical protein COS62_00690 [Zetaproteobacteria bac